MEIESSMKDLPNHEKCNEWTYLQWRRKNSKIKIIIQFRDWFFFLLESTWRAQKIYVMTALLLWAPERGGGGGLACI